MSDLISRQAAIDLIMETDPWWCEGMTRAIFEGIKALPSAQPEQKTGKWIPVTERLPEPCETVLAFRIFGVHGQLSEVCFAHTLKMFDRINWSMVGVTHWMPLPEPPTIIEAEVKE